MIAVVLAWVAPFSAGQETTKIHLDTSEASFGVLTGLNACGYDQDLASSEPLREQIRGEVAKAAQASPEASDAAKQLCDFYRDHLLGNPGRDLAQYVSLTLFLGPPPAFTPKVKEAELPPDATYVLGVVPLLAKFYERVGVHAIWQKHQAQYAALVERYHAPLAKMVFDTDIYLKLALSGYLGREFTVYLEPMSAPSQANARNYAADYYVVVSPSETSLKLDQIRHTYLHYVLDPMAMKRALTMKRIQPLLDSVKTAPMDESFKEDISLLVTESMIRAIEARTMLGGKATPDAQRELVDSSMREGYILTQYFYEVFTKFEKDPAGLRDAYAEMLSNLDVAGEHRRASQVQFAAQATPELLAGSRPQPQPMLRLAEQKLALGDTGGAQKLAQQILDEKKEDAGHALFILARIATANRDLEGARTYFERTLDISHEPRLVAWSHIYLGRLLDIQEERESAVEHYRLALQAGDASPAVKSAAEKGIKQPYEPPTAAREQAQ